MRYNGIGGVEGRSATFTIFTRSLDDYINEVIASKMGMNIEEVPKEVGDSIQSSIQASIEYHDYMLHPQHNITDDSYITYHRLMADTYRGLKTI